MKINIIDLFCGAGGFSLGFEQEGFESVLAIDKWSDAVETYNYNREKFLSDAKTMEDYDLFKKYFKDLPKIKLERFLRKNLVRTKIYKKILKLGKIIRKRD